MQRQKLALLQKLDLYSKGDFVKVFLNINLYSQDDLNKRV